MSRRRGIVVGVVALAAVAGVLGVNSVRESAEGSGPPALMLRESMFDFGTVRPGQKLSREFEFTNEGGETLKIGELTTSCGCTAAQPDQDSVPPGGTGVIRVSFQLPMNSDPVAHSVAVASNDPARPLVQIHVRADPEWPLAADPEAVAAGLIVGGEDVIHEVELYTPSAEAFDVTAVQPSADWISVEPLRQDGRRFRYRITLEAPEKSGSFAESIVFSTSVEERPRLTVSVTGDVVLAAKVVPSQFLLGVQAPGAEVVRNLAIRSGGAARHIAAIRLQQSDLDWELHDWQTEERADTSDVRLTLRVPETTGYHRGQVLISFESGDEDLKVPVSCMVSAAAEIRDSSGADEEEPE